MTLQTSIVAPATSDPWAEATAAANEWRGAAIQVFAHSEFAVSETLERLSSVRDRGTSVRLRPLVGQRFADLAEALAGPFAAEGMKAAEALTAFSRHEPMRPVLCHGVAKILQDRTGRWAIIFRLVALKGKGVERSVHTIEQSEAQPILRELEANGRKLSAALQSLRDRLPS